MHISLILRNNDSFDTNSDITILDQQTTIGEKKIGPDNLSEAGVA